MEWSPEEEVETAMPVAIIPVSILLSTPLEIFQHLEQVPIREDTTTMHETNVYANPIWKQFLLDHLITTAAQLLRQNPSIYKEEEKNPKILENYENNPHKKRGKREQSNTQEIRNTYIKYTLQILFFSQNTHNLYFLFLILQICAEKQMHTNTYIYSYSK